MNSKQVHWYCTILIAVLFITSSCTLPVKSKSEEQLLRIPYTSSLDQSNREYFLYLPKGYDKNIDEKWPVILFLHGNGERGNGMDELDYVLIHGPLYEAWIQKRDLPFIMIVPQLHMFGKDTLVNYIANRTSASIPIRLQHGKPPRPEKFITTQPMTAAEAIDSIPDIKRRDAGWDHVEEDLLAMIDKTIENYNVDTHRIYLSGLSYGAFGTWYLASKNPTLFAAINPVVGWGHPDLMESIAKHKMPVWAFSGGRDRTVEEKYFFKGMNTLEKLGHTNIRFTSHKDMGHDTWRRVYAGEDIYNWLLQHRTSLNTK